jgi:crotonobetainyl-CoA:carnitine CoA-transferase CaiB-like acyl-CoA transferase
MSDGRKAWENSPMGALSHIRVLDLSRVLAGPWCAQNLADLGAEVIKVERPGSGDDTRHWGPPFAKDSSGKDTTESAYYISINRNKKSITLDISTAEGQEIVRGLVAKSDVVIENYKVGQLRKYGLDFESLKSIKPDLIYCSITGFGQTGPYQQRAGYDFILQGMGGFMSITGEADHLPGGGPQKAGVAIVDLFTGMYASSAILAAVIHRDQTGVGQYIDIALLDTQVAMLANISSNYLCSGVSPHRWGNAHPNVVPYQTFQTSDSWIIVAVGNDSQFRNFVKAGNREPLANDHRFATNPARIQNRDSLIPLLVEMVKEKTKIEWIQLLEQAGVPCGPINNLQEVFENEQVIARGIEMKVPHPTAGTMKLVRSPIRLSETPVDVRMPPPLLGEHTDEVLRHDLGMSAEQIAQLHQKGIV